MRISSAPKHTLNKNINPAFNKSNSIMDLKNKTSAFRIEELHTHTQTSKNPKTLNPKPYWTTLFSRWYLPLAPAVCRQTYMWVISTTYLKHTDKENPETVKAMVKMQACTMLYKMGLSHFSLFIYCLFLLWFCSLLQLIWLCPPHQKKKRS